MNKQQIAKTAKSNQYSESPSKVGPDALRKKKKKKKKKKNQKTSVSKICAKAKVEQLPDDFYEEENILFCKFCLHSVEIFRVDIINRSYKIKKSFDKEVLKKKGHLNWNRRQLQFSWNVKYGMILFLILFFFKCALWHSQTQNEAISIKIL